MKKTRQYNKQKTVKHDSTRVKARGATREPNEEEKVPFKWGRAVVLVGFLSCVLYGGSQLHWDSIYKKAFEATHRPLANVKIESDFRFVSQQQLQDIISSRLHGSFVDLDLGDVKLTIEKNPWIEEVSIERIWPDSIKLKVKEHRPIARWNNNGYISNDGKLIIVESNETLMDLPLLSGAEGKSHEVTKNYLVFTEILKNSQLKVTGISVDKKSSWEINIDNTFSLVLGRQRIHERLENFQYVYEKHLKDQKTNIVRIDMRYEQGLAVKWKESALVAVSAAK